MDDRDAFIFHFYLDSKLEVQYVELEEGESINGEFIGTFECFDNEAMVLANFIQSGVDAVAKINNRKKLNTLIN